MRVVQVAAVPADPAAVPQAAGDVSAVQWVAVDELRRMEGKAFLYAIHATASAI